MSNENKSWFKKALEKYDQFCDPVVKFDPDGDEKQDNEATSEQKNKQD